MNKELEELEPGQLENFMRAFDNHIGSCRASCACGREFYNSDDIGCFEHGELEKLEASNATNLNHCVGYVEFEGSQYVSDCDCWHPRAAKIIKWLGFMGGRVAEFLTMEKRRLEKVAADAPVVVSVEVPPGDEWKPILLAPRNATHLRVMMWDGTIHEDAHWACDLSGEEQPPFQGWFVPVKDHAGKVTAYSGIKVPKWWALPEAGKK